jgi:excisionase family DNA binding protein
MNKTKGENHSLITKNSTITNNSIQLNSDKLFFEKQIVREWLSTEEAALYLSISENALRIMVHRDQIKAYKFGRRLRFKVVDCSALFKRKGA